MTTSYGWPWTRLAFAAVVAVSAACAANAATRESRPRLLRSKRAHGIDP